MYDENDCGIGRPKIGGSFLFSLPLVASCKENLPSLATSCVVRRASCLDSLSICGRCLDKFVRSPVASFRPRAPSRPRFVVLIALIGLCALFLISSHLISHYCLVFYFQIWHLALSLGLLMYLPSMHVYVYHVIFAACKDHW